MSVLLATGQPDMSAMFRQHLVNNGFDVSDQEIYHRKYLSEMLEMENPTILVFHDDFLESETITSRENEQEILKLIEYWRIKHDDQLRVVYICQRERSDPHLSQLIALNVLDIFHEQSINPQTFISQLKNPPKFGNVAYIASGSMENDPVLVEEIEDDVEASLLVEEIEEQVTKKAPKVTLNNTKASVNAALAKLKKVSKKEKLPLTKERIQKNITEKQENSSRNHLEESEIDTFNPLNIPAATDKEIPVIKVVDDTVKQNAGEGAKRRNKITNDRINLKNNHSLSQVPVKEKTIIQERIVGSIFVGIMGLESNTGTTHLSLLLANYLKRRGLKVAVFEANRNNHLFAIEYAYEGGGNYISESNSFNINGIEHFKAIKHFDVSSIINHYDFIILDIGNPENSDFIEEFDRAHVKIITAHSSEWKREKIRHFIDNKQDIRLDQLKLALPYANTSISKELKKETGILSFPIPYQPEPYNDSDEVNSILEEMLKGFLPNEKEKKSFNKLFVCIVISIILLIIAILSFL